MKRKPRGCSRGLEPDEGTSSLLDAPDTIPRHKSNKVRAPTRRAWERDGPGLVISPGWVEQAQMTN